ncbi:ATP synthase mitochondrial F1 complex assembly factor 2 [Vespula maculifrons]|uniref:ATP synthase mitochondrial F1 complex assembly factor 2 n=2 Tax=Vespula TaxID=7451 RepID=A0A834JGD8_VESVU|nr:ATP synthase mitochondrial F1 complex assembly factor 2 [Vespula pensylvanica]XP_043677284.1 ATP synthase mitochondrial F1 complex assembly factor 2 [Vespula pensylvanica]XP_050859664.1 ATP synthase mitochondrial F1 complex assembly factor 2 [Vespula vulgaris]XP_050859665.1 ATP synthase mitochondrial F1 complex assembly factor 2 [Vespula vulgaris]KAF7388168.1 hypothetical protein HZH66_010935 [Vespula vulgaris]
MSSFKYRQFTAAFMIIRSMATVKRFYRRTNILSSGGKFEITLDQRKLKTPKGKIFEVNNKGLALAVATEWDAQKDIIEKENMHLTALCNTVLDNPNNQTKLDIVNYITNCLEIDTILFHSSEIDDLYKLQVEKWDPIVQWFCDHYKVNIVKTQSIDTPTVPIETKTVLTRHLSSYDFNAVHGFLYAVNALKSVILTLAAIERVIDVEKAVELSRLEEIYQISHWGNIEWSHDLSKYDLQSRVAAAVLFVHLNSYLVTSLPKGNKILNS